LTRDKQSAETELQQLQQRWSQEKELAAKIGQLRARLEGRPPQNGDQPAPAQPAESGQDPPSPRAALGTSPPKPAPSPNNAKTTADAADQPLSAEERDRLRAELNATDDQLRQLQGEMPLVFPCVNSAAVAETVAAWTGIPVGRMVADEIHTVLSLKQLMERSIVGQSHALDRIAQSIRTSRANLSDPRTPIGVFLLAGTSGVGKTETAITLAELLYGGEQNMTVINMSEFKEEHKV
jgi:type VI secretion system protein VasG